MAPRDSDWTKVDPERSIVLVQHGEKASGTDDPGLTKRGVRQALACARLLADRGGIVAIHSSPARRCVETARPIADAVRLPLAIDERLVERMNWEPSSGMSLEDFLADWDRATRDRGYLPSIGDSSRATGARMAEASARLVGTHATGTVVCVTHGGATVDLLRDLMGDEALERAARGVIADGVPGGALTTLSVTPSGFRVTDLVATGHIPFADRTGHRVE